MGPEIMNWCLKKFEKIKYKKGCINDFNAFNNFLDYFLSRFSSLYRNFYKAKLRFLKIDYDYRFFSQKSNI